MFAVIKTGGKQYIVKEKDQLKIEKLVVEEGKTVDFHCMVSTPTNPMYVNTFRNKPPFSLKLEDSGVVPGLKLHPSRCGISSR